MERKGLWDIKGSEGDIHSDSLLSLYLQRNYCYYFIYFLLWIRTCLDAFLPWNDPPKAAFFSFQMQPIFVHWLVRSRVNQALSERSIPNLFFFVNTALCFTCIIRADPPYTQNMQAASGPQNTRGPLALKDVWVSFLSLTSGYKNMNYHLF